MDIDLGVNSPIKVGLFSKLKKGFQLVDDSELKRKENQLYEKVKSLNEFKIYFFNKVYKDSSYSDEIAYVYFDVGRMEDKVGIVCSCDRSELGISIRKTLDKLFSDKTVTDFVCNIERNF